MRSAIEKDIAELDEMIDEILLASRLDAAVPQRERNRRSAGAPWPRRQRATTRRTRRQTWRACAATCGGCAA